MAANSGVTIKRALLRLRGCGLGSMPGTAAEILSERVREEICPEKLSAREWIEVVETAHMAGIPTTATMMYGHIETVEEKVDHHIALRELQDDTGGFVSFIPLRFHPRNTVLSHIEIADSEATQREIAVGRLMLDNFRHIKAYWIMTGLETGRLALTGGADDFDGTVVEEKITHMAGAATPEGLSGDDISALIRAEGKIPLQR